MVYFTPSICLILFASHAVNAQLFGFPNLGGLGRSALRGPVPSPQSTATPEKDSNKESDFEGDQVVKNIAVKANSGGTVEQNLLDKIPNCNNVARLWIRASFHDCGTFDRKSNTGGCDGSLQFELSRGDNAGLEATIKFFRDLKSKFPQTSMADLIALGGKLSFEVCTGRSLGDFQTGRSDARRPNGDGLLPGPRISASKVKQMFVDRMGLSLEETVALIGGAHSTSQVHRANSPGLKSGKLDDTLNRADSVYFRQIQQPAKPNHGRIPTDETMARDGEMGRLFRRFASDQGDMLDVYSKAFTKMLKFGFQEAGIDEVTTTSTATKTSTDDSKATKTSTASDDEKTTTNVGRDETTTSTRTRSVETEPPSKETTDASGEKPTPILTPGTENEFDDNYFNSLLDDLIPGDRQKTTTTRSSATEDDTVTRSPVERKVTRIRRRRIIVSRVIDQYGTHVSTYTFELGNETPTMTSGEDAPTPTATAPSLDKPTTTAESTTTTSSSDRTSTSSENTTTGTSLKDSPSTTTSTSESSSTTSASNAPSQETPPPTTTTASVEGGDAVVTAIVPQTASASKEVQLPSTLASLLADKEESHHLPLVNFNELKSQFPSYSWTDFEKELASSVSTESSSLTSLVSQATPIVTESKDQTTPTTNSSSSSSSSSLFVNGTAISGFSNITSSTNSTMQTTDSEPVYPSPTNLMANGGADINASSGTGRLSETKTVDSVYPTFPGGEKTVSNADTFSKTSGSHRQTTLKWTTVTLLVSFLFHF